MQFKVESDQVRKNIQLFQQALILIKQERGKIDKQTQSKEKTYRAFLNRSTGEIYFSDLLPDHTLLLKKNWKAIEINCIPGKADTEIVFQVKEQNKRFFSDEDLSNVAYQVFHETLGTLNRISSLFQKHHTFSEKLAEITKLEIPEPKSLAEQDLVHKAWYPLDRLKAEDLLNQHPYGSYLFRQDEYAKILEATLQQKHSRKIQCLTLTYSAPQRKVTDLTLVKDGEKWLVYNDDPSLKGKKYSNVEEVLEQLKSFCKIPVCYRT